MDKKRNIVKQGYELINAKYKLNTSEIKFILNAITKINKDDDNFKEYTITIKELENTLDKDQNETRLKQFAKKILSKPLEIPTQNGWFVANWFSDIEYVRGKAMFKVSFSSKLKPYLLELKEKFVKYHIENIINLNSEYSIKIYQLLKQYENIQSRTFTVVELQDLLQVPDSYKIKYNDFKKKVLEVSKKELVQKCDIYFEYKEIKESRKIVQIEFIIKKNSQSIKLDYKELQKYKYDDMYFGKSFLSNDKEYTIKQVQKQKDKTFRVLTMDKKAKDKWFNFDTEKQLKDVIKVYKQLRKIKHS